MPATSLELYSPRHTRPRDFSSSNPPALSRRKPSTHLDHSSKSRCRHPASPEVSHFDTIPWHYSVTPPAVGLPQAQVHSRHLCWRNYLGSMVGSMCYCLPHCCPPHRRSPQR